MEMIKFPADHAGNLASQGPGGGARLPFGAFLLDTSGRVLKHNAEDGAAPGGLVGRNFFDEIVPRARDPQFLGRFRQGVEQGTLNTVFEYACREGGQDARVRVHMKLASIDEGVWIYLKRA